MSTLFSQLLENKLLFGVASAIGGVLLAQIVKQITNRRSLFTYFVRHGRVGVSADDPVLGSVRVTWNNNPVANLYTSTIELINQSFSDFEKVVVRIYTNDTILLTEKAEIVGTTQALFWTENYKQLLKIEPGAEPTQLQREIHLSRRDYEVPVFNRGQVVRFHYLNAAKTASQPTIWLDVQHKGVRTKFRIPATLVLGVPQPQAALAGGVSGILFLGLLLSYTNTVWVAALWGLIYGYVAILPGALLIRAWRFVRDWFGG